MLVKHFKSKSNYVCKIAGILNTTAVPVVLVNLLDFSDQEKFSDMLESLKNLYLEHDQPPLLVIDTIGQVISSNKLAWIDSLIEIHPDIKVIHYTSGWDPGNGKYHTITDFTTFFKHLTNMWGDAFSGVATHHFIALANHPRAHRTRFINLMLNKKLQRYGYFSIGSGWPVQQAKEYFEGNRQCLGIDIENLSYFPSHLDDIVQSDIWGQDQAKTLQLTYNISDYRISDALLHVVLETSYEQLTDLYLDTDMAVPMITEKTVKPFALGQIPLILGPQGMVDKIRNIGFDLFDDIVDTSYDLEPDPEIRISKFVDSLEKFIQAHPVYQLQNLKHKLLHRLRSNRSLAEKFINADIVYQKITYYLSTINQSPTTEIQKPDWLYEQPPIQFNFQNRGKTLLWNGTDTESLFKKNMADTTGSNLIKKLGWDRTEISYKYNSHGFRCDEFDGRPCALALGCSFTEGTGLPIEMTWPSLLSKMIDLHVWNLGSGGASIDTAFRTLEFYIDKLRPRAVFLLIPPKNRFEYCDIDNGYPVAHPSHPSQKHQSFIKEWMTQTRNGEYNTRKTLLAMQKLCDNHAVPMLYVDHEVTEHATRLTTPDLARDLMHRGSLYQMNKADTFFKQFLAIQ